MDIARKGNSQEKVNLFLLLKTTVATQNNSIRTIYIRAKININQHNSTCRLCREWKETKISSKLTQTKYMTILIWVEKLNHWELCKRENFYYPIKYYMHRRESVRQNEAQKFMFFYEFDKQKHHLIPTRRPDRRLINNKAESGVYWIYLFLQTTDRK